MRMPQSMSRWWGALAHRRRRAYAIRAAAGAVTLIVYVALAAAWAVHEEPDDTAEVFTPAQEAQYLPEAEAGDGGTVEVVDVGFTPLLDIADDDMISWAASVTNTSSEWATKVSLAVVVEGEDGSQLSIIGGYVTTFMISPGQTVTVGETSYVSDVAADAAVLIHMEQWWAPGQWEDLVATAVFSEITTEMVGVGDDVPYWGEDTVDRIVDVDGRLRVSFRVEWDGRPLSSPDLAMVFRDTDGTLLGAADGTLYGVQLPTGWSKHHLDARYNIPQGASIDDLELTFVSRN